MAPGLNYVFMCFVINISNHMNLYNMYVYDPFKVLSKEGT
jgi:hypothetical protein